jgi:uncharacterized protein
VILASALGLLMGLVVGALGGGGGVLTVPLLVFVLGLTAQSATTSSVVIVGITALFGVLARVRGHLIDRRMAVAFGVLGIPAAYLGTLLNHRVDQHVLLLAFSAITLLAATAMLVNDHADGSEPAEPSSAGGTTVTVARPATGSLATAVKVAVCGLLVGFLTGFLGVGGGFLVVPALVIVLRVPMVLAVGTSLLIIVFNAVSSVVSRLGAPLDLDWRVVVPFTVLAVIGSLLGKRVADRLSGETLTRAFAAMLILVGGYVAVQALGAFW